MTLASPAEAADAASHATTLDLKGLNCPLPVLRAGKALRRLKPGDLLIVLCTDPLAAIDIPHLVNETGDTLEGQDVRHGEMTFRIRRRRT
ncbi:sulfurtransferase TusA family protein [Methylocella sp.]|uniref:sulfurtransferase TusA family protein n=1 Tax=Methylocella sp. TaxID=1978226 RepID=UPI003783B5CF